jgi:sulfatase maturation enzyme AslB (radical SAM superfamily)
VTRCRGSTSARPSPWSSSSASSPVRIAPKTATSPSDAGVRLAALRELWLHTGTACNLSCPFCHEASAPGDARIGALLFPQAKHAIDAAVTFGVERFAFTGGEPLILRGILDILAYAQQFRPCLVITNGTAPLLRRPQHLARLREGRHPVSFRVSIDHPDEARHDAGRGLKTFRKALEGLRLLHQAGFEVGVTRLQDPDEDRASIESRFRALFRRQGLPQDLSLLALPELGRPNEAPALMPRSSDIEPIVAPACSRSRMAIAVGAGIHYLPCPLVDDEPERSLGDSLASACANPVQPTHRRCKICRTAGVDYSGLP